MRTGPLRSAVVGVGHLGSLHARFLAELSSTDLVGVYDADEARARTVAAENGTTAFSSLTALIDHGRLDFAVVATPTDHHCAVATALLENGIAALVEKPLTKTLQEADQLLAAARNREVSLGVGHVERFNPVVGAARSHVDDPLFIECDRVHPFPFRSTDVGVVLDLMIHDIDLVLWLAGSQLESIEGVGASVLSSSEDMAFARLTFENGCVALVRASRVSLRKVRKLRVFCPDLYVSLDYLSRKGTTIKVRPGAKERIAELAGDGMDNPMAFLQFLEIHDLTVEEDQPLRAELAAFINALEAGKPPPVTGEAGRDALACALMIEEEIRRNLDSIRKKRENLTGGANE